MIKEDFVYFYHISEASTLLSKGNLVIGRNVSLENIIFNEKNKSNIAIYRNWFSFRQFRQVLISTSLSGFLTFQDWANLWIAS
jgi:hypothetical protein